MRSTAVSKPLSLRRPLQAHIAERDDGGSERGEGKKDYDDGDNNNSNDYYFIT